MHRLATTLLFLASPALHAGAPPAKLPRGYTIPLINLAQAKLSTWFGPALVRSHRVLA
jgi:hypothetical protein